MIRTLLIALALFAALGPGQAFARHGDRSAQSGPVNVSREQALSIARENGLTRVRETDLRDGIWKVEGWNAAGRVMEIRISANTGAVLEVEFYPS